MKPLGILLYENKVVNHRSLLKILVNPILHIFGYYMEFKKKFHDEFYIPPENNFLFPESESI